ncbi:hypothetical protein K466DRAFT_161615 [Polyporus arcularius HHB13444]|uniref:Uncharacterized protein n=1 Tax=Polyporus arcularius HHB13444 TaxID=1314778 RepID=A0A5C3PU97_9APHY|nr:hypothetical protein K466DRAFT_161615 [Polyporus arcularius HHB13444]
MVESVVLTSFLIQAGDDPGHAARPRSPDWRSIPHPRAQHPRSQFPCYSVCPRCARVPTKNCQNELEVGAPHSPRTPTCRAITQEYMQDALLYSTYQSSRYCRSGAALCATSEC